MVCVLFLKAQRVDTHGYDHEIHSAVKALPLKTGFTSWAFKKNVRKPVRDLKTGGGRRPKDKRKKAEEKEKQMHVHKMHVLKEEKPEERQNER